MNIEFLTAEKCPDFIEYCRKHRLEVDDSFLYDEDLNEFEPSLENPTYIVLNAEDQIVGAASLIMNDYNKRGKQSRFRIFHTIIDNQKVYEQLFRNILGHTDVINKLYVFVPDVNVKLKEAVVALSFELERISFILVRGDQEIPEISLPEGYEIRSYQSGRDEEAWCAVRNAGFAKLKGSETPIKPVDVKKMVAADDYIEGGMMLLYHQEKPVGVIRGVADEYENRPTLCIGPLAILPEYQGKGLGRCLLRVALQFGKRKGYAQSILCVNGENENAKRLYINEGFSVTESATCYRYDLIEKK